MIIINDLLKDSVYQTILRKFEDGSFTYGKKYKTKIYSYEDREDIVLDEKTLGKYIDAMIYRKIKLHEVPNIIRNEEFYVHTFTVEDVYEYIKNNINQFDREFFKSVIMNNDYALMFDKNCFEIMPLEYIDEEMVTLSILNATSNNKWFISVNRRKPESITQDVWKLAARLYGERTFTEFLDITPEKYKDEEYYQELFKCTYNGNTRIDNRDRYLNDDPTVLMDYVPKEILTKEFLLKLLLDDLRNIARFSEYALETEIPVSQDKDGNPVMKKIWQYLIELNGELIRCIELNEERINYFKSLYDKDSIEYFGFKYQLRDYNRKNKKNEQRNNNLDFVLMDAMIYAMEGENPNKAFDNEVARNREDMKKSTDLLPIFYYGEVPEEYKKKYDSEEYLQMMYEKYGIKILEEYDYLLYKVVLPEGFTIEYDKYSGKVKDKTGMTVIAFCRDDKFYNRSAYVTRIREDIQNKDELDSQDNQESLTNKNEGTVKSLKKRNN